MTLIRITRLSDRTFTAPRLNPSGESGLLQSMLATKGRDGLAAIERLRNRCELLEAEENMTAMVRTIDYGWIVRICKDYRRPIYDG
ncbi:MAG: hypothetical protein EOP84_04275 [Verrucomicrobiaceae bacterium]|nr:MAG: hypothetical protein EOP84_04275 [Verrucomicrobiaceae bacterium]